MRLKIFCIVILLLVVNISRTIAQNVGVGTANPAQKLDVAGKIKLADDNTPPQKGTMRWSETTQDFEGYNGVEWISLTLSNLNNNNWQQPGQPAGTVTNVNQVAGAVINGRFGSSVSIHNNYAVVGAPEETSNNTTNGGAAYIYKSADNGNTWQLVTRITAPNNPDESPDKFGTSVSVSENIVAVAAPYRNDGKGIIFIYRTVNDGSSWDYVTQINVSSSNDNANLGRALDLDSNLLVAGAPGFDEPVLPGNTNQPSDGAVFVFKTTDNGSTWSQTKLDAAGIIYAGGATNFSARFGDAAAIEDSIVIAGAPFYKLTSGALAPDGAIRIFKTTDNGTTWNIVTTRLGAQGASMGTTVSTAGVARIYNSNYAGNASLRTYNFSVNSSEFEFNNTNNPYTGTVPLAANNKSCDNTDKLFYITWPLETVTSNCNINIPNAKGLVRVFKHSNGIYQDYFHITDPTVALTDANYLLSINVACHKDLFIIGLPYADINGQEKGKVIIGKMK